MRDAPSISTLATILCIATSASAAKQATGGSGSCEAVARYPDGTEVKRVCIVEGVEGSKASASGGVSSELSFLKDTRWNWNNWRDVIFKADGSFLAPAEGCEREGNPKCTWTTDEDRLYVNFGGAGKHTLTANDDKSQLYGARDADGDEVTATRRR